MTPINELRDVDPAVSYSVAAFAHAATQYMERHSWCGRINAGYLDKAWPGILGVFYFEIEPASPEVDTSVWVVVGDLPYAYLCNDNKTGMEALEAYVREMRQWVEAARNGRPVDDLIPVNVPPTAEYAEMLASRLKFIEEEILPVYDDPSVPDV